MGFFDIFRQPKSRARNITEVLNSATARAVQSSKLDCRVTAVQRAGRNIVGNTGFIDLSGGTTNQTISSKLTCTIDTSQQAKLTNDVRNALNATANAIATGIVAPKTQSLVKTQIRNILSHENIQSAVGEVVVLLSQSSTPDIIGNAGTIIDRNRTTNQEITSVSDGLLKSKQLQDSIQKVANVIDSNATSESTGIKGSDITKWLLLIAFILIIVISIYIFIRYKMKSSGQMSRQSGLSGLS